MKKENKAYVIPHTHWDREWRYPIWKNRVLLIEFMEELLDLLDRDPEYHNFLLDGQAVPIDDYLEVCPFDRERVEKYIKQGRISVGPWYTLPDLYPLDGECLVRNLLRGTRAASKHGACMKVGYNSFGWGQTAQLPQIYKGFGIDFIVCAKKVSKERAPESEFWWEAPDGTRTLTTRLGDHARANFYFHAYLKAKYGINCLSSDFKYRKEMTGMAYHNSDVLAKDEDFFVLNSKMDYDKKELEAGMEDAWNATEDTVFKDTRLFLNGTDFSTAHPELSKMIKDLNEIKEDTLFINTSLKEYTDDLKDMVSSKELKVICGELRDGPSCDCSGNALASRSYLKILNKEAERRLFGKAEPMLAFGSTLGGNDMKGYLAKAWDYMLKAHPHDSINGVTQDRTADDVEYRLWQACEMAQAACDKGAGFFLKEINTYGFPSDDQLLVLFHMQPWETEDVVKVCLTSAQEDKAWNFRAFDTDGSELMVQDAHRDEKTYPVHDLQARPWPYSTDRHTFYLETGKLPAFGYKVIRLVKEKEFERTHFYWMPMRKSIGKNICLADQILENEYLKVMVNANGTFDLIQKEHQRIYEGLHYFEDTGDVGNYWAYYPPYHNQTHTTLNSCASVWCEDNGPLSATIGIRYIMNLPAKGYESRCGVKGEGKRSEETEELVITSWITLKKGARRLEIKTKLHNTIENHRLRVALPTGIESEKVCTAGHFTVDEREALNQPEKDGSFYPEMQTLPMQNFVDLHDGSHGIAVPNRCFCEYEKREDERNTLYLTLFRSMGNMIVTWWEAVGEFSDQKGSQMKRDLEFDYAIYPHEGDWEKGEVYKETKEFNSPAFSYQLCGRSQGTLPSEAGFLSISNPNLVVSALKNAEDRESILLRVYNPTKQDIHAKMKWQIPGKEVESIWQCSMEEERQRELPLQDKNTAEIHAGIGKILTYEICIKR
ncbi:glycoside hydrolase family 38 C-terminal domain-containing protein [uncultured Robinsoniella sp.]|uniref:glycoside hydrolase family 38 N-terminal domain-containing protein n=1 Tax=uncultured Robinsoniella sp. TaxID=904190 RepID=UPI00374F16A0